MSNRILIDGRIGTVAFGTLQVGDLFTSEYPANRENLYLKTEMMARRTVDAPRNSVNLRTGLAYMWREDKPVYKLPEGTVVTITTGTGIYYGCEH